MQMKKRWVQGWIFFFCLFFSASISVKAKEIVKVAVPLDLQTVQAYDQKKEQFYGISIDVLKLLEKKMNVSFQYIAATSYQEALQWLKKGNVRVVCGVLDDRNLENRGELQLSDPYLKLNETIVKNKKKSTNKEQTMAVVRGKIDPKTETIRIVQYGSLEECIRAVNDGNADFCYGDLTSVEQILQSPSINQVEVAAVPNEDSDLCFGFSKKERKEWITKFNQSLREISDNEMQKIIQKNEKTVAEVSFSLLSFAYANPIFTVFLIIILFLFILLAIIYLSSVKIRNERMVSKMAQMEKERYRVATEITNDVLFEYDIETDLMQLSDKFKEVYGRETVMFAFTKLSHEENIKEDDMEIFRRFCKDLQNGADMVEAEFRILNGDGRYVWCHIKGKTLYDNRKRPWKVHGKIINIDERKQELERLLLKSQKDPLTRLYNKAVTKQLISEIIEQSVDEKHAFLFIDIDNFKQVNDRYGHLTGDHVLATIASHMRVMFRKEDVVGRIGGDEFVIFMRDIESKQQIIEKATKLKKTFENSNRKEDKKIDVTASVGIAIYPEDGNTYDLLLANADQALYHVKENGKDAFHFSQDRPEK